MAGNKDLKLKRPFKDDYGSTSQEAFKKAKRKPNRVIGLSRYDEGENEAIIAKHEAELEVKAINVKLELLDHLIMLFVLKSDKANLESELHLAEAKIADLKVPDIDWFKLGEPNMYD